MKTQSSSQAQDSVPGRLHVIEMIIPGARMISTWQWRWLRAHLMAGVTILTMLVLLWEGVWRIRWSRSL